MPYRFSLRLTNQIILLLFFFALCAQGLSQKIVGSAQLMIHVNSDQSEAFLNGQPVQFESLPKNINGRIMLPLQETVQFLDQSSFSLPLSIGKLTVQSDLTASLDDVVQDKSHVLAVDGVIYISARLLADALDVPLLFDGKILTLTHIRSAGEALLPQARFSTDKQIYAPGERIIYTEYSFDPDGTDITARRWKGKQDTFFRPGTYPISLQVTNTRGAQSKPTTRTITVAGEPIANPVSYALKYAEIGDSFPDMSILTYPTVPLQPVYGENYPLVFSDSPEAPNSSGILYQDSLSGRARLLAYHINNIGKPARLYIMARNTENTPIDIQIKNMGETAPTRIESQLGQSTLLDYFAHSEEQVLRLDVGQQTALYASPTLNVGSGVNVLQEILATGRVELTFVFLEEGLPPTPQVLQQIPYLAPDGKHQRGTFPYGVRKLRAYLSQFPARLMIGDGNLDSVLHGIDRLTGETQRLSGNYGVLYDLEIIGTKNTAIALTPRGGLYRGAMHVTDGKIEQTIKLPRVGNALLPDQPVLLWRPQSERLLIDFIPASGSHLPIGFLFYSTEDALYRNLKTYQP